MAREKRSLTLHGHRTSVALETEFWHVVDQQAEALEMSLAGLLTRIDDERVSAKSSLGLAAYLRVWALLTVMRAAKNGHEE
ncbi:MAG: ribbon-helix-helix domain-containing protein [Alphaproteobacteria bacterium]